MFTVAFVGAFPATFVDPVGTRLGGACKLVVADERDVLSLMPEVDVLVTLAFTEAMSAAGTRLKLVQVPGAGLDRIARSAIRPGVALANAYGHETGIAEYVMGAMLVLTRSFRRIDAALRGGTWESQWRPGVPPPPPWPELAGRTLGILGYGHIGQALATRARAFDMRVCAIRRTVGDSFEDDLELLGGLDILAEVLRRADYLAVTLPLTVETRGLLGAAQLALMPSHAILVNVGRAEILDEDALYEALAAGRLAGAALDVWYRYPVSPEPTQPSRRPFQELDNVLMTPHVSGWTDGMLAARAEVVTENIRRAMSGEPLINTVPV
jgi:phosphoglycerate dehydrogenase-like enzyme